MDLTNQYYKKILSYLKEITNTELYNINVAAKEVAKQIKNDRIFYIYGPGGHSNLASQEVFYRAGGLLHVSAILDEGTLLSSGALRSLEMERMPNYGRIVIDNYNLKEGDLLLVVNAYGINTATIDAALEAKERGVRTIGINSHRHANNTPKDHPARHSLKHNLHDITDVAVDSKIDLGDAVIKVDGQEQLVGPVSTFCNSFILNTICMEATQILSNEGIEVPVLKSGNATGGDEWNLRFFERFKEKVKHL